ncbi:hypothetical protein FRB96_001210 [Tulasnella sp. 330]|nr:hypothetical protein FRB96_001210 [Tulasnella sp. 330]
MPTPEAPNAIAGSPKKRKEKIPGQTNSSKKTSTATNPRNTKPFSKPLKPSGIDSSSLEGRDISADPRPHVNSRLKPATYAKPVTDFQNNRKQKAPQTIRTKQGAQPTDGRPALEKKTVFRTTLDNPYQIEWPIVSLNIENGVLACVVELLEGVAAWSERRDLENKRRKNRKHKAQKRGTQQGAKKGKKVEPQELPSEGKVVSGSSEVLPFGVSTFKGFIKKRKRDNNDDDYCDDPSEAEQGGLEDQNQADETRRSTEKPLAKKRKLTPPVTPAEDAEGIESIDIIPIEVSKAEPSELQRPKILDHTIRGINEVTKRLERQSAALRQPGAEQTEAAIRLVVVCRADVDSPMMIAHLPMLVAACNSRAPVPDDSALSYLDVIMVGLPYGAEETLSAACGLRKAAVMAFDTFSPGLDRITQQYLPSIPVLKAPWLAIVPVSVSNPGLTSSAIATQFVPTHIKQLKTSAPKNMTEAKKRRQLERKAAKEAKKAGATGRVKPLRKVVLSAAKAKDDTGAASADSTECTLAAATQRKGLSKEKEKDEGFPLQDTETELGIEIDP